MSNDWTPIFCGSAFLVIALTFIALIVIRERARRKRDEPDLLTPEQADAVRRQGNALALPFFGMILFGSIFWCISQIFPVIKAQIPLILQAILIILGLAAGAYIGISSIKYQISALRGRGYSKYPKGQEAVTGGIVILLVIAVILYVAWLTVTGH